MKYVLSAWMRDRPGVLHRVAGLLRRRNFNIDSLQVSQSEIAGISRMTFVVDGDERVVEQVEKQMAKLVDVTRIENLSRTPLVARELAMLRVAVSGQQRTQVLQLVEIFKAQVVDVSSESMLLQMVGNQAKINALIELLQEFELLEMVRTGPVAIARKGEVDVIEEDIALNGGPHQNGVGY
jgi:acetolactate synthase-1/3 small subunit